MSETCTTEHENREIFVSGFLQIAFFERNWTPGWFLAFDVWYRRLDAAGFLWLRDRVNATIESGRLPEGFSDATERLSEIERIGIASGCFSPAQVGPFARMPSGFSWWDGCPRWVEDF